MRPGYGGDCCHDGYGQYDNGGYYKTNFDVFFRGREISDAHVSSFEVLGDGYAKEPVRRLSRSPVTAMPRMLSTHISMAAKYADSIYG